MDSTVGNDAWAYVLRPPKEDESDWHFKMAEQYWIDPDAIDAEPEPLWEGPLSNAFREWMDNE